MPRPTPPMAGIGIGRRPFEDDDEETSRCPSSDEVEGSMSIASSIEDDLELDDSCGYWNRESIPGDLHRVWSGCCTGARSRLLGVYAGG